MKVLDVLAPLTSRKFRTPPPAEEEGEAWHLVGLVYAMTPWGAIRRGTPMVVRDRACVRALLSAGFAAYVPRGRKPADVLADAELWDDD